MAARTSRRPSISVLAQTTGFSQGTISRAFNNRYGVNPETREKILRAAREMGYEPGNAEARPSGGDWRLVAPGLLNGTYARLGAAILHEANASGARIEVTGSLRTVQQQNEILEEIQPDELDALIIATLSEEAKGTLAQLQARGLAVLALDSLPHQGFDTLDLDFGFSLRRMVRHLAEIGHRSFGYVGIAAEAEEKTSPNRPLVQYRSSVEMLLGASFQANFCSPHEEPGFVASQAWNGSRPTAVLCETDEIALSLIGYAQRRGWSVPGDLSVITQSDSPAARAAGITALYLDWEKAARLICRAVQERSQFPAHVSRHVRIRAELILRESHAAKRG